MLQAQREELKVEGRALNAELSASLSAIPADYVRHGWQLVPVPRGSKGPQHKGWNKREYCIADPAKAAAWGGNFGLAHAYSGTCAIDFDRLDDATKWLKEHGLDVSELFNAFGAVRINSGRPNRAKLLYRLDTPLPSLTLADGALEFRCADNNGITTKQDLLPPSIHPATGQPYRWEYAEQLIGHWSMLPAIPPAVLELWKSLISSPPSANPARAAAPYDLRRLEVALTKRDPDCKYNEWIRVGMGLHDESGGSEDGFRIWDDWSKRGSKKYRGTDDLRPHWNSFSSAPGKTVIKAGSILRRDPASVDEFADDEADANRQRFVVIPDYQFVDRARLTWHLKGVLPKAELAVVFGPSGSGKSFFVFDIAAAISTGKPWQGRKTTKGKAVFVLAEGATGFRNRLLAYTKMHAGSFPGVDIIDGADPGQENRCRRRGLLIALNEVCGSQPLA